jgi:precorrin-6Y C5,15-methyltransferase (decarboxylating)
VHEAAAALRRLDFKTDLVQIQIHRSDPMPWSERLEALNPVWIITGIRKAESGSVKSEGGRRKKK